MAEIGRADQPEPWRYAVAGASEYGGRQAALSQLAWGLGGFLVGALFWHVIGLWDFLGEIVNPHKQSGSLIARVLKDRQVPGVTAADAGSLEAAARLDAQNCTTLVLDRMLGETRAQPCVLVIRNVPGEFQAGPERGVMQTAARMDRPADEQ